MPKDNTRKSIFPHHNALAHYIDIVVTKLELELQLFRHPSYSLLGLLLLPVPQYERISDGTGHILKQCNYGNQGLFYGIESIVLLV